MYAGRTPCALQRRRTTSSGEQVAALSSLDALMGYADLAYTVLHLSGDRAEYWTGLMVEEMALLKGWRDADYRRYGQLLPNAKPPAREKDGAKPRAPR